MTNSAQSESRGRLPAWMLILCVLIAIVATGLSIGLPYYRQYRAIQYIEANGGSTEAEPDGPEWLHRHMPRKVMRNFESVSRVVLENTGVTDPILFTSVG